MKTNPFPHNPHYKHSRNAKNVVDGVAVETQEVRYEDITLPQEAVTTNEPRKTTRRRRKVESQPDES